MVEWLTPVAWWGLAALAIPVLVHLLARRQSRRIRFPSLKFLPAAQTAALRTRALEDWPLLLVRLAILAAAVSALAGPVFLSDARRESWNARTVRAIVMHDVPDTTAEELADAEERGSLVSARFEDGRLVDSLVSAVGWLAAQPPAAREIVVIGDLREGALNARDLSVVPGFVGLRFLPLTPGAQTTEVDQRAVAGEAGEGLSAYDVHVTARADGTETRYTARAGEASPRVEVLAAPEEQRVADAVLRAVLTEGVLLGRYADRAVTIVFAGAPGADAISLSSPQPDWMRATLARVPAGNGGMRDGALVVTLDLRASDPSAPSIVARIVRAAFDDPLDGLEPRRIPAAALAAWSRPPGGSPGVPPADEGDRRWFWGAALLLIVIEGFLRRQRTSATVGLTTGASAGEPISEEGAKVA